MQLMSRCATNFSVRVRVWVRVTARVIVVMRNARCKVLRGAEYHTNITQKDVTHRRNVAA